MTYAIPINVVAADGSGMAGTAFLLHDNKNQWLVTCAHCVTGEANTPNNGALWVGRSLKALGTDLVLPMFNVRGTPRFRCTLNENDEIVDVIAFPLSEDERKFLAAFDSFDRSKILSPVTGDAVVFEGFPGLSQEITMRNRISAKIEIVDGLKFKLSEPSRNGFSGGPVYSASGLIGIVHADAGISPNFTNAHALNLKAIDDHIFRS